MFVLRLGRLIAWVTVMVLALATTAGALALWSITHGPQPLWNTGDIHPHALLATYGLLLVTPWWALLAVMFSRFNWLGDRPGKQADDAPSSAATRASSAMLRPSQG